MKADAAKPLILWAEDSEDDAFIISRALNKVEIPYSITRVFDGDQAIVSLREKKPDLLLLDLKMPKLDGFDVLAIVRQTPYLKDLPVVILSASELPNDREKAKALGADYFVKTVEMHDLALALKTRFSQLLEGA